MTALRANGFVVVPAAVERGEATVDERPLQGCGDRRYVLLTNDRDFVELGATIDHAGVVVFTSQALAPGAVTRALRRIDRQYTQDALDNALVWLDNWL